MIRRNRKGLSFCRRKKIKVSAYRNEQDVLLTTREKNVLKLVAEANTNKEIAAALGISPSTVKRHMENILSKLHLRNRIEAAVYAVRAGYCPMESRLVGRRECAIWQVDRQGHPLL